MTRLKVHISKLRDYAAEAGHWPSHYSLGTRCGVRQPREYTNRRDRATCKGCLKVKV